MFLIESNHVRDAVNKLGGPTKVSNFLGVSNGAVHAWMRRGKVSDIDMAKRLAELSGKKVSEVRPCND